MGERIEAPAAGIDGGQAIIDWLVARGIDHVFQVPGESFLPILEALRTATDIVTVTQRHESGVSFATEGYGKIAGRPAACVVTRGPGVANLSIGLQTAQYDATPLIAFIGLTPRDEEGSGAFQEIDLDSVFGSVVKRVLVVSSRAHLPAVLDQAYVAATTGRPGPVMIGLPTDLLGQRAPARTAPVLSSPALTADADLSAVAALIDAAQAPVLLVGTAAVRGDAAAAISELAAASGLPVFAAWRMFSSADNDDPAFVGSLGLGAAPAVTAAIGRSDCIVSFGFAMDQITARAVGFPRDATVIQFAPATVDSLVRHVYPAAVHQYVIDPAVAARTLRSHVKPRTDGFSALGIESRPVVPAGVRAAAAGVDVAHLMRELDRVLPANAVVSSDAGNFAHWLLRYIRFGADRAYIGPRNGAMGYGIPAAIGATFAAPERPAWAICGDGGALMTANELATAASLARRVRVVVVDNHAYGTIRARQDLEFAGNLFGTSLSGVDFAVLAGAFGIPAWTVRSDDEVAAALEQLNATDGPGLLHVIAQERPLAPA